MSSPQITWDAEPQQIKWDDERPSVPKPPNPILNAPTPGALSRGATAFGAAAGDLFQAGSSMRGGGVPGESFTPQVGSKAEQLAKSGDWKGAVKEAAREKIAAEPSIGSAAESAALAIPSMIASPIQRAASGDIAGGIGEAAANYPALVLNPEAREAAPGGMRAVGRTMESHPYVAGHVIGAAAGEAVGHPFIGGYLGRYLHEPIRSIGSRLSKVGTEPPGGPFRDVPEPGPPDVFNVPEKPTIAPPRVSDTPAPVRIGPGAIPPEDVAVNPRVLAGNKGVRTTPIGLLPEHVEEAPKPTIAAPDYAPIKNPERVLRGQLDQMLNPPKVDIKPGVPIREQVPKAAPEGFTPVDSSALRSYRYDPASQKLSVQTHQGTIHTYADVSPEEARSFAQAESKGKAWKDIRDNHVSDKVKAIKSLRSAGPDTPAPEYQPKAARRPTIAPPTEAPKVAAVEAEKPTIASPAEAKPQGPPPVVPKASEDLTPQLQKSLEQVRAKKGLSLGSLRRNPKTGESGFAANVMSLFSGRAPTGSTVPLMEHPLSMEKPTIPSLAEALNDFRKQQGLRPVDVARFPEKAIARAKQIGIPEMKFQLKQPESGVDWYGKDIGRYEKAVTQEHPELQDPSKMTIFKAINAGTSLGNKSEPALTNALDVFNEYKQTGKVPLVNPATGKGWPNGQYNAYQNTFRTLQSMLDKMGEQEAAKWLTEKHPISELRQFNKNVAGKANDMEYGALALGPKAGPFFLNMSGVEQKLTADVWMTRTWNRWMGTAFGDDREMVEAPRNEAERSTMSQAVEELAKHWGISTRDAQAVLWNYEQKLYTAHGIPSEQPSYGTAAESVVKRRMGTGEPRAAREAEEGRESALIRAGTH